MTVPLRHDLPLAARQTVSCFTAPNFGKMAPTPAPAGVGRGSSRSMSQESNQGRVQRIARYGWGVCGWGTCVWSTWLAVAFLVLLAAPSLARGPSSVADVAEGLQDAVVNISTTQTLKGTAENAPGTPGPKGSPFEEFFDDFFDDEDSDGVPRKVSSLGSGFVIDPSGLIVTNHHVIEGADEIIVNFTDGTKLKVVKILGHDPKTDLALLKVEPKKPLKAVAFGNSSNMRVGDWVMAIGNPFGLGGSVTVGIISATKRDINAGPYDDFLQTDAAINRGNSGGPLFNMEGEVIGVNTAIISPTGGSIGIGFAVPSNSAIKVLDQLKQYGETRRGWLGVHVQNVTDEIAEGLELAQPIGELVDVTVKIGRLPEDEEDEEDAVEQDMEMPEQEDLLGLSMGPLTDAMRERFGIADTIEGVVITEVAPDSPAARKNVRPGDVIVEVTQEEVRQPQDVVARLQAVKRSGRGRPLGDD